MTDVTLLSEHHDGPGDHNKCDEPDLAMMIMMSVMEIKMEDGAGDDEDEDAYDEDDDDDDESW